MTWSFDPDTHAVDKSIQELMDKGIVTMFSLGGEPLISLTEYGHYLIADMEAKPQTDEQPWTEEDEENLQNFLNEVDKDLDKIRQG